jgi:ribonuclease HI
LQQPILSGRIGKWAYALIEYDLAYESLKSMKDQVVADFIVGHSIDQNNDELCNLVSIRPWKLFLDGSAYREGQGVGVVLVSPRGAIFEQSVHLEYFCTNNQAEYEAILLGLQILSSMGIKGVKAFGDLLLVTQQIAGVFQCFDGSLNIYLDKCLQIIALFDDFIVQHVSRDEKTLTNDLVQQASGFWSNRGKFGFLEKLDVPVCQTRQSDFWPMHSAIICYAEPSSTKPDILVSETGWSEISRISDEASKMTTTDPNDWRTPLVCYMENLGYIADRKVRRQVLKYVVLDNTLYRRTIDGLFLRCLGSDQSKIAMGEVHEGICGTHQSAYKMKWLLHCAGFYWPTMISDCLRYYKGYESCQKFRDVQLAPTTMLHPIIKPWPYHGWALDFIGQIHPASSKGHQFVLVATDYFTKWTKAIPLKNMMHKEVIHFILEHIIHRFGITQTLTTDQGSSFMSHQVREFTESLKIKLLCSSPYYAHANGQTESSIKTLIKLIARGGMKSCWKRYGHMASPNIVL